MTSTAPPQARLTAGVRFGYASGSLATGIFSTVPSILLLFYCTETLRIPPGWAAMIMLVPKAWSVLWDPVVGFWSDRTANLRGMLLTGAVGVVVCFALIFATPWHSPLAAAGWVGLSYFGLAAAYSLFAVPYISLPARRVRDDAERARLISGRMVCAMVGVLAGAGLAPVIVQHGASPREGYRLMGCSLALVCALAMAGPLRVLPALPPPTAPSAGAAPVSLRRQVAVVAASRQLRALLGAYLLQLTAGGMLSAVAPYMVTTVFHRPAGDIGLAFGLLLAVTTLCIQPWAGLARRIGARRALVLAVLIYAAATLLLGAATLLPVPWPNVVLLFGLTGVPFGGLQVLPFIMSARIIAHDGAGMAEGTLTGVWTGSEKMGLALGPSIIGAAFAVFGSLHTQRMRVFITLAPACLTLLSLALAPRPHPPTETPS